MPVQEDQLTRGDTKKFALALTQLDGSPKPLANVTVWFTLKPAASDSPNDSDALIQHKIVIDGSGTPISSSGWAIGGNDPNQNGLPVTGPASGVLTHTIAADESTMLAPGTYVYDVQVKIDGDEVYTPILGFKLDVIADITRDMT